MKQSKMRRIALGAARGQARKQKLVPEKMTADEALAVLDDVYRVDGILIASLWYANASDAQIRAFKKEWEEWKTKIMNDCSSRQ